MNGVGDKRRPACVIPADVGYLPPHHQLQADLCPVLTGLACHAYLLGEAHAGSWTSYHQFLGAAVRLSANTPLDTQLRQSCS